MGINRHGASFNFIIWGLLFFSLICIEKLGLIRVLNKYKVFSHIYTIFFLLIGWTVFAITDFESMKVFFSKLFIYNNGTEYIYYLRNYAISLCIGIFFSMPMSSKFYLKIENMITMKSEIAMEIIKTIILMSIFIISVAYLVDATYNPFLYFRF